VIPARLIWAISGQVDPQAGSVRVGGTPRRSLDSPATRLGLGGQVAIDATTKIGREQKRHALRANPLQPRPKLEAHLGWALGRIGPGDIDLPAIPIRLLFWLHAFEACGSNGWRARAA